MKLFLDSGALVAFHNKDDENHSTATGLFRELASGALGVTKLYCSDYVLDESITACYARTKSRKAAIQLGSAIVQSSSIVLLRLGIGDFDEAWQMFRDKYQDVPLSFTDCTTFVLTRLYNIPNVFAFDRHFDALGLNRLPR